MQRVVVAKDEDFAFYCFEGADLGGLGCGVGEPELEGDLGEEGVGEMERKIRERGRGGGRGRGGEAIGTTFTRCILNNDTT